MIMDCGCDKWNLYGGVHKRIHNNRSIELISKAVFKTLDSGIQTFIFDMDTIY
jgi:hypothetical protein